MSSKTSSGKAATGALSIAALGVVYGDIGTSPLYSFNEAFIGAHGLAPTETNILAVLSTLFWAVTLLASFKYIWIMLRFDNDGEGGVLALTALASRITGGAQRWIPFIFAAGIFGATLLYGDAIIVPAVSVLSAVEGLRISTDQFQPFIEPITISVLVALFLIQRKGTGSVGKMFGPVMLLWFLTLGVLGAISVVKNPGVLRAVNPEYALTFAVAHPFGMFLLMAAVFLALTGSEMLYADMGHFGAKPIRLAWCYLVCPSLLLNYFGQGALLMTKTTVSANPFYLLAPDGLLLPLVVLATIATVIASQSTIAGAFSLTMQAMHMGYLPRLYIRHTSDSQRGQIYVPAVNWLLMIAVIMLVLRFGTSDALTAAYGIAVSGTMIITTLLAILITLIQPGRRRVLLLGALLVFGALELVFLISNMTKVLSGGWMPLVLGVILFVMLSTWKRGSQLVAAQRQKLDIPMADFIAGFQPDVPRVAGTAIYMTADPTLVPSALFHNLKHFKVMHERTIFLHVVTANVPYIPQEQRLAVRQLAPGIYDATVNFGFRQESDVPLALQGMAAYGVELEPMTTTFFTARANVMDGPGGMAAWRCALYAWMTRQSEGATGFFNLPPNQVVELGTKVRL